MRWCTVLACRWISLSCISSHFVYFSCQDVAIKKHSHGPYTCNLNLSFIFQLVNERWLECELSLFPIQLHKIFNSFCNWNITSSPPSSSHRQPTWASWTIGSRKWKTWASTPETARSTLECLWQMSVNGRNRGSPNSWRNGWRRISGTYSQVLETLMLFCFFLSRGGVAFLCLGWHSGVI